MADRLKTDESVAKGLERIVKKEIKSAVEELAAAKESDEAVHEARTSIKKIRAVLRLVREDVDQLTDKDMKRLRRTGRLLSPLRDAQVMIQTARDLCHHYPRAVTGRACAEVGRAVDGQWERADRAAKVDRTTRRAGMTLRALQRSAKQWNFKGLHFGDLRRRLKGSYRKARKAMGVARKSQEASDFHQWRKLTKDVWYHLRLFEDRVPAIRHQVANLKQLETLLGDEHNLLLLRTYIVEDRAFEGDPQALAPLKTYSERREAELRREALARGARLFSRKAKDFIRRLRQMRRRPNQQPRHRRRRQSRRAEASRTAA